MTHERLFADIGIAVACRSVCSHDVDLLTGEERASLAGSAPAVRCRAAAARIVARELLSAAGFPGWTLPRRPGNAPEWPPGLVGSLSHSDTHAAAALARLDRFAGVGIDIEPAEPLPPEIVDLVVGPGEARITRPEDLTGRVLFAAKEACYKAVYPIDRRFLEHQDVTIDLGSGLAETCYGRRALLAVHVDHRIVVLARVPLGSTLR
jgi:4'-phosphopantetheinyl transferase EntD